MIEGEFGELLKTMRPSAQLFRLVRDMFMDAWEQRHAQTKEIRKTIKRDLGRIEKQIDGFLERIVDASSATAIKAYERKIDMLERERLIAEEKLAETRAENGARSAKAKENLELALSFLSSPWKIWASGDIQLRRLVLKLAFAERLPYCRKQDLELLKPPYPSRC